MNKPSQTTLLLVCILASCAPQVVLPPKTPIEVIVKKPTLPEIRITVDTELNDKKKVLAQFIVEHYSSILYDGHCGIELHGHSTLVAPKKSYDIELRTKDNEEKTDGILGLKPEEDFVLLANYFDRSFIRNAMAFKMWESLGHYVPQYRFCELYLNNEYQGLYMLAERIKVDVNRVNLSTSDSPMGDWQDNDPFLLRLDWGYGTIPSRNKSISGGYLSYDPLYPNPKKSDDNAALLEAETISNVMSAMELSFTNILSPDSCGDEDDTNYQSVIEKYQFHSLRCNPDEVHYSKLVNVESFADLFIVNELSKNPDGFKTSTYLYRDKSDQVAGEINAGPIWDFDLAFGNVSFDTYDRVSGWAFRQTGEYSNLIKMPVWWHQLTCDPDFILLCEKRLKELNNAFSTIQSNNLVDNLMYRLNPYISRDEDKWKAVRFEQRSLSKTRQDSALSEATWLKHFYQQRMKWMQNNLSKINCIPPLAVSLALEDTKEIKPNTSSRTFTIELPSNLFDKDGEYDIPFAPEGFGYVYHVVNEKGKTIARGAINQTRLVVSYVDWSPGVHYLEVTSSSEIEGPASPVTSAVPNFYHLLVKLVVP